MIIQSLYKRYQQLVEDPDSGISGLHYSAGKVSFVLILQTDGTLDQVREVREHKGKKLVPKQVIVPEQPGRSSGIKPYFLSDKPDYLLGYTPLGVDRTISDMKKLEDARRKFAKSAQLHHEVLSGCQDAGAQAVLSFFYKWDIENGRNHPELQRIQSDLDKGSDCNLAFQLIGDSVMVHERPLVRQAWTRYCESQKGSTGQVSQCLITGNWGETIAQTHDIKIKGVRGAQTSGAALVSFNADSFLSYDKKQSLNAPVSKTAAFAYATALNHLLASDKNRIYGLGDMSVVYWAEPSPRSVDMEDMFSVFFTQKQEDDARINAVTAEVEDAIKRIREGLPLQPEIQGANETPFYVLGLSPNNARLSVRLFWQGTFGSVFTKLAQHADDLSISTVSNRSFRTPTIYRILEETRRVGSDGKKVGDPPPPGLSGEIFRAVIEGRPYPQTLYMAMINRIRADRIVNPLRAAIIKAYLIRYARASHHEALKEVLSVAINEKTTNTAYRLGRAFAVLERAQQDAAGGYKVLNATIKDRYFASASSRPAAVFPVLIRLSQHHISKLKFGFKRDEELQEILAGVDSFPVHLNIYEQGLFILGYYHQKDQFFIGNKKGEGSSHQEADSIEEEE